METSSFLKVNLPIFLLSPSSTSTRSAIAKTSIKSSTKSTLKARNPTPSPSFPSVLFNAFDHIINNFIDPPLSLSVDPRFVLADNFSPVKELPPTKCDVVRGSLPLCINGAYIRNGPNPQFLPRGPHHLFNGDGMLHSVHIAGGEATLCSRYVKTNKYTVERDAGFPVFPNILSGFSGFFASAARSAVSAGRVFTGQFDPLSGGIGVANTSLAFFGNRLYALCESDLPYAIRLSPNGDIETLGRHDFDQKLPISMTAHPKIDPETGEAFAFRYSIIPPFITYFRFDSAGEKQPDVGIYSMEKSTYLHDFITTKKYAIFSDIQMGFNLFESMMNGGSPIRYDPSKVPKLGAIDQYAKDDKDMRWFNTPGFNFFHAINAWDEEDGFVVVAPNVLSMGNALERVDLVQSMVEKVKIDFKTGTVTRQPLSTKNLEFGVINPAYAGKKNRYVYAGVADSLPKVSGVVKLDVSRGAKEECTVACRMYEEGCYGGEPFFVAKEQENSAAAEEDDGYLVTFIHDEKRGESEFLVMDAKSPELDIVAAVKLPQRVPYGFHGLFIPASDLHKQQIL